jgi:hypothetical protein
MRFLENIVLEEPYGISMIEVALSYYENEEVELWIER